MYRSALPIIAVATMSAAAADRIQIAVCDDTGLPAPVLAHAERLFEFVMSRAGVLTTWNACSARADPLAPQLTIRIRLSPARFKSSAPLIVLGQTFRVISRPEYAEVFMDAIREYSATTLQADSSDVLGCAMLHEAGHLLGLDHGPRGVMVQRYSEIELAAVLHNRLRFTNYEARVLIAELRRRVGVASTAALRRPNSKNAASPDGGWFSDALYPALR